MTMTEHEAEQLLKPLRELPKIEARKEGASRRQGARRPLRVAVTIGVVGLLGTGSAFAAIERFTGEGSSSSVREEKRLRRLTTASDKEIQAMVRGRSGGSIPPSMVHPDDLRKAIREQYAERFPDELRFYGKGHELLDVTKCKWPRPRRDCLGDPIAAIKRHPGATSVEIWSNGKPIAGGG